MGPHSCLFAVVVVFFFLLFFPFSIPTRSGNLLHFHANDSQAVQYHVVPGVVPRASKARNCISWTTQSDNFIFVLLGHSHFSEKRRKKDGVNVIGIRTDHVLFCERAPFYFKLKEIPRGSNVHGRIRNFNLISDNVTP